MNSSDFVNLKIYLGGVLLNVYDSVQHLESENIYCIVGGSGFIRKSIIDCKVGYEINCIHTFALLCS